jgi:YD repeat-containing protein
LETVTDGDSRTLKFKYNGEGLVESVTDPMGHVIEYAYTSKNLTSVKIEGKVRWKFEYESPHLLTKITDEREHSIMIKYEATTHRVTEETIAGHTRKWTYGTPAGTETTIAEPNGSETITKFNAASEPTKVTRKGATPTTATTCVNHKPLVAPKPTSPGTPPNQSQSSSPMKQIAISTDPKTYPWSKSTPAKNQPTSTTTNRAPHAYSQTTKAKTSVLTLSALMAS